MRKREESEAKHTIPGITAAGSKCQRTNNYTWLPRGRNDEARHHSWTLPSVIRRDGSLGKIRELAGHARYPSRGRTRRSAGTVESVSGFLRGDNSPEDETAGRARKKGKRFAAASVVCARQRLGNKGDAPAGIGSREQNNSEGPRER